MSDDGSIHSIERSEESPDTDLGRLATELVEFFESRDLPESIKGTRLVLFLDTTTHGLLCNSGYEGEDAAMIAAVLTHMKAVFIAAGSDLSLMGIDELHGMFKGGSN